MKKLVSLFLMIFMMCGFITPVNATSSQVELNSKNAYLFDRSTRLSYIDQESQKQIYPASMTKLLTVSIALDKIDNLQEEVRLKMEDFNGLFAAGASMAGFQPDEKVTYEDLLYGALLPSGADACNALARLLFGNVQGMVDAMNEKVNQLGLKQTHFTNVTGLHDDNHYTSVYDMAMILDDALNNPTFKKVFQTRIHQDSKKQRTWKSAIQRSGEMMNEDTSGLTGGKSGYTDKAQLTLASTMTVDGHELIFVTANAKGQRSHKHVIDASNVYKYMKENYKNHVLYKKDDEIEQLLFMTTYPLVYHYKAPQDIQILIHQSLDTSDIETKIEKSFLHLEPAKIGEKVGKVTFSYHNQDLYTFDMIMPVNLSLSYLVCMVYAVICVGIIVVGVLLVKKYKIKKSRF